MIKFSFCHTDNQNITLILGNQKMPGQGNFNLRTRSGVQEDWQNNTVRIKICFLSRLPGSIVQFKLCLLFFHATKPEVCFASYHSNVWGEKE